MYLYDKDFFIKNTAESFYWAGFIAADGCVEKKKTARNTNRLSIHLAKKDKEHLEKFKKSINFTGPIEDKGNSCRITIHSAKICKDLEQFNIVPRKTKIYTFPKWMIGSSLVNHFMRGYFDGDGSVYVRKGKGRFIDTLNFKICGTESFVSTYKDVLAIRVPKLIFPLNIESYRGISCFKCCGNRKVTKIREFLYEDADDLKLDRKYNIMYRDIFVDMPKSFRAKKIVGINIRTNKEIEFDSISDAGRNGFIGSEISRCCSGKRKTHNGYAWHFVG